MSRTESTATRRWRSDSGWVRLLGLVLVVLGAISALGSARVAAQGGEVFVVQVHGDIDLGLAPYLARVLAQAERENAQAVVIEIDTPGGRLDAVLQMRDSLVGSQTRTIAFVNRQAFSAGALLTIAAHEIYLAPGAVVGAATPITETGETADEKVISAVRTTFRSTAEVRGRDPRVAEAMVDPAVEVEGLVTSGQLLTLTTAEAQTWGYADGVVANREELLQAAGLAGATIHETSPSPAENIVRFLTNPVVASLLISLGVLAIYAGLMSEGIGVTTGVGVTLLAAFFWGHVIAGLAGWEGIVLVVIGLALMGAEVFVIPGFGIAGLLGLAALAGGLFISLIDETIVTDADLLRAGSTIGLSLLIAMAGGALGLAFWPKLPFLRRLVLRDQLDRAAASGGATAGAGRPVGGTPTAGAPAERTTGGSPSSLIGATGVALTDLRPGGFARIGGERVDVVTQGDYLTAGETVEVIADEGYRRVVRRLARAADDPPATSAG